MRELPRFSGRIAKAPEGHLDPVLLETARVARRRFMGRALALGAGAAATGFRRVEECDYESSSPMSRKSSCDKQPAASRRTLLAVVA